MSSWQNLRRLIGVWTGENNPIFLRELACAPNWHSVAWQVGRSTGAALVLGGLLCYLSLAMVCFVSLLHIALALLLVWWLWLGQVLAPVVVREREQRTWDVLRLTPFSAETILLSKAAGALWPLRHSIRIMQGVIVLFAICAGIVSLTNISLLASTNSAEVPGPVICGVTIVLPLVSAAAFLIDRAQHYVLMGMSVLAVSVSVRSVRAARAGAINVLFAVWLVDVSVAGALLVHANSGGHLDGEWLVFLAAFGPTIPYLAELPVWQAALCMAGTLAAREIAVRLLWRWMVRAVQR
ncbi:MAG: hypothetical protein JXJ20_00605 [Anaerolineae bacterium]|nr:hypothetical protein [Anaerolineae bacterium]